MKGRTYMKKRAGFFSKLAFFSVVFFLLISIMKMNFQINDLKDTKNNLIEQRDQILLSIEELEEQFNSPINEDSIKKVAKERGKNKNEVYMECV